HHPAQPRGEGVAHAHGRGEGPSLFPEGGAEDGAAQRAHTDRRQALSRPARAARRAARRGRAPHGRRSSPPARDAQAGAEKRRQAMIVTWMLYALVIGASLTAAAFALERATMA